MAETAQSIRTCEGCSQNNRFLGVMIVFIVYENVIANKHRNRMTAVICEEDFANTETWSTVLVIHVLH